MLITPENVGTKFPSTYVIHRNALSAAKLKSTMTKSRNMTLILKSRRHPESGQRLAPGPDFKSEAILGPLTKAQLAADRIESNQKSFKT